MSKSTIEFEIENLNATIWASGKTLITNGDSSSITSKKKKITRGEKILQQIIIRPQKK